MYAKYFANLWKTKEINTFAQRTPIAITASREQKLTFEIIGEQYNNYMPIIRVDDTVDLSKIKALSLDTPYIADKIHADYKQTMSQVLNDLGYESNPTDKKERLVTGETVGNNGEVEGMRNSALMLRQRFCAACNATFGLNLSVEFNSDLPTQINGWLGNEKIDDINAGGGTNE